MEVQMTDFENAAFAVFVVLLSRAILSFNLNFYVPISKVAPLRRCYRSLLTVLVRSTRTWVERNNEMLLQIRSSTSAKTFTSRAALLLAYVHLAPPLP